MSSFQTRACGWWSEQKNYTLKSLHWNKKKFHYSDYFGQTLFCPIGIQQTHFSDDLDQSSHSHCHVVFLPDKKILNYTAANLFWKNNFRTSAVENLIDNH